MNQPSVPPPGGPQQQQAARPVAPVLPNGHARRRTNSIAPALPHAFYPPRQQQPHPPPPPPPAAAPTYPPPPPQYYPHQQFPQYAAPPTPIEAAAPPPPQAYASPEPMVEQEHKPFRLPLPWLSAPDEPFPPRRRRRRRVPPASKRLLPKPDIITPATTNPPSEGGDSPENTPISTAPPSATSATPSVATRRPAPALPLTPPPAPTATSKPKPKPQENGNNAASVVSSEASSTTVVPATTNAVDTPPAPPADSQQAPEQKSEPVAAPAAPEAAETEVEATGTEPEAAATEPEAAATEPEATATEPEAAAPEPVPAPTPAPPPPKPSSWAALLQKPKTASAVNGTAAAAKKGPADGKYGSLAEALSDFQIDGSVISMPFLEPRGLVNTGNMCFMNAVLQMLVFCGPFYYFLDRISKGAARNFKDDTPLIEALIMFMREFRAIYPANHNKLTIKAEDLEALGDPFTPEFVYEALSKISKFSHMRRGHQQDAEEFLGFLLDGLHEEAVTVMSKATSAANPNGITTTTSAATSPGPDADDGGWMEVGHKQRAATTRKTEIVESPITKIFGGHLRSEFRVPGLKPSVTLEPYTPLQLDIGAADVQSVTDALKHLTTPEKMQGDFRGRGGEVTATKQLWIETLPPVLILHLKRFQYDERGGTHKVGKRIAYPLTLEIPREAMAPMKRGGPLPRYRLIGVVYHHGTSASGGHYTVDVLRQDGRSWIRLDDKVIKRVGEEEVMVDVKELAGGEAEEEREGWVNGWEEANGSGGSSGGKGGKRWVGKETGRSAYILFYQRI